jgi:hypothetical protein
MDKIVLIGNARISMQSSQIPELYTLPASRIHPPPELLVPLENFRRLLFCLLALALAFGPELVFSFLGFGFGFGFLPELLPEEPVGQISAFSCQLSGWTKSPMTPQLLLVACHPIVIVRTSWTVHLCAILGTRPRLISWTGLEVIRGKLVRQELNKYSLLRSTFLAW